MRAGRRALLRIVTVTFVVTFVGLAFAQIQHERLQHQNLRTECGDQKAELATARANLTAARLSLQHQATAFEALRSSHEDLQALHRDSMDWGPLRAPRDCVREVILMDETAWPADRDGTLAHCLNAYVWSEGERTRMVEDLDQCFQFCFPSHRPQRDDPRAGDSDSTSIDWPDGHVVERFPSHEKNGRASDGE